MTHEPTQFYGGVKRVKFEGYPSFSESTTQGAIETLRWSSIKLLCVREIAEEQLKAFNPNLDAERVSEAATDIAAYLQQALDFYLSSHTTSESTRPLYLYYCYMNIAKAIVELRNPGLRLRKLVHGISRQTSASSFLDESIEIKQEGIFPELISIRKNFAWGRRSHRIAIVDLLSSMQSITSECDLVFGKSFSPTYILDPLLVIDPNVNEFRFEFSVSTSQLKSDESSRSLIDVLANAGVSIEELGITKVSRKLSPGMSVGVECRSYKSSDSWPYKTDSEALDFTAKLFRQMGASYRQHSGGNGTELYRYLDLSEWMPKWCRLDQMEIAYLVMYWFGSIVRYDPARLKVYQESKVWHVLEGFLHESVVEIWDDFDWALHNKLSVISRAL